ncbi:hypothetical protein Tco_1338847 [Tanacetum coccineum]
MFQSQRRSVIAAYCLTDSCEPTSPWHNRPLKTNRLDFKIPQPHSQGKHKHSIPIVEISPTSQCGMTWCRRLTGAWLKLLEAPVIIAVSSCRVPIHRLLFSFSSCNFATVGMLDYTVIAIPFVEGSGSYLHTIKVEYEEETTKMRHVRNATTRNDVFQVVQNCKSKDKQHIRAMGFKPRLHLRMWSDVEDIYDETAHFMASGCANDASLYEEDDYDIYDNYDIKGLSKSNWCFVDIRIRGPHR